MARIRTIKPEIWQDEKLAPLPPITRLVFIALISLADDAGRLVDNQRLLDASIFPETDDSSRESLARLSRIRRIRRGKTASGQRIIEIVNWSQHQRVDHPNVKGSLPEIVEEEQLTEIPEALASHSREIPEALAHHTNDQRPTTSTNDLTTSGVSVETPALTLIAQKPAKASKRPEPKFPHFPDALCKTLYADWITRVGAVEYPRFRRALGPVFSIPEAERPDHAPRDAELVRALKTYGDFGAGPWGSVEKAAACLSALAIELRDTRGNPEAGLLAIKRIVQGQAPQVARNGAHA